MEDLPSLPCHSKGEGNFSIEFHRGVHGEQIEGPCYLMNTCFVCNIVFVARKATTQKAASCIIGTLCNILGLASITHEIVPETNAVCHKCSLAVDEYLKLQDQIQVLTKMLVELSRVLRKKVVDTYINTSTNRKNFHVKTRLYQVCSSTNLDVNASKRIKEHDLPSVVNYALGNVSNGGENITIQNCSPSQDFASVTGHDIPATVENHENVANNNINSADDDNVSMECPSPAMADDFFGTVSDCDDSSNENVLPVKNANDTPSVNLHEQSRDDSGVVGDKTAPKNVTASSVAIAPITGNEICVPVVPSNINDANAAKEWSEDKRRNRPIIVTKRRSHPCKFCGKLFPSDFSLKMHERTHTGDKPFACDTCGRPFNNKAAMLNHKETHDPSRYQGEPQYLCDFPNCGKKYHLKLTLYTHKRDHMGIKRLKKRKSRDPNAPPKKKMKKQADPNSPPKKKTVVKKEVDPNAPPKPKQKAKRPKEIKLDADGNPIPAEQKPDRIKREPISKKRVRRRYFPKVPFKCSECEKEFTQSYLLKQHMLVHTGELPHECKICGRRFALKGNMDKHMKSHDPTRFTGEPKHICDFCGEAFHVPVTLYHHRRRKHLGLEEKYKKMYKVFRKKNREKRRLAAHKPCECKICGETFDSLYKLSYHNTYRHSEKVHKCEICEKPFAEAYRAKDHLKTHDPKYLYNKFFRLTCPSCPPEKLGFPSKQAVRKHWTEEHKDEAIPKEFVKNMLDEYVCKMCLEVDGKRPTYRHSSSLYKHYKSYHSDYAKLKGKVWKPIGGAEGRAKSSRRQSSDDDELSMSDEDSETGSEINFSESEDEVEGKNKLMKKKTENQNCIVSTRSGLRSTNNSNIVKNGSSKLTKAYVREVLKGRELNIILTRVDVSNSLRKTEQDSPDSRKSLGIKNDGQKPIDEISHEIKEETKESEEEAFQSDNFVSGSWKKPLFSYTTPLVIHNPLSKDKKVSSILIPPTVPSTSDTSGNKEVG